jgi:rhomboid protease GluP
MTYPPPSGDPPLEQLPPQPGFIPLPTSRPRVTYILLALIILVWLAGFALNQETLLALGAIETRSIVNGQIWRLFTAMFLHASLTHLFFNGYALFIFGLQMERVYGSGRFLLIYLLAGLFGSLASFALHKNVFAVGASGAIFGIIGTQLAFFVLHHNKFGRFGRQNLMNTVVIIVINVIFGISVPRIDNLAHMGGLVAGFALGYALAPRYKIVDQFTASQRVVDTVTLLNRAWVPVVAVSLLAGGLMLALAVR